MLKIFQLKKNISPLEGDIKFDYICYQFNKILRRIKNRSYSFRTNAISRKTKRSIHIWYSNQNDVRIYIKNILGDFSNFTAHCPEKQKDLILAYAEKYYKRSFNVLGSGWTSLHDLPWNKDFISGFEWPPNKFYLDYSPVDLKNSADVKIPWDLSRSHHLLILGQAYLLTKNEKYASEFIAQTEDWLKKNPFLRSINWYSPICSAIRAVNWLYALNMFIDSPYIQDEFLLDIFNSLYQHAWYLSRNKEKVIVNSSNHYDANLAGLLTLGLVFRDTPEGKSWFNNAKYYLFREIRNQILPSGVVYERSINYIRFVNELFTYPFILLKKNSYYIPSDIEYRIEKQFEFTMHYIKPDNTSPVIGDQDDARYLPFSIQHNLDHRYLLAIAAVVFKRPDFKSSAEYTQDAFFLYGSQAKKEYDAIPENPYPQVIRSHAFPDAGFFIMRNNDFYVFITNSGGGKYFDDPLTFGTHTHADLLSFELFFDKRTYIIDPGTYTYTRDPAERNLFRSTKMHNTVTIDGQDQSEILPDQLFRFETRAYPKTIKWSSDDLYDLFLGEHTGYQRLPEPLMHRRTFKLDKTNNELEISDEFLGKGYHEITLYFHFDNGIDFCISENGICTILQQERNISLQFKEIPGGLAHLEKIPSYVSKSYGTKMESFTLMAKMDCIETPATIKTMISILNG